MGLCFQSGLLLARYDFHSDKDQKAATVKNCHVGIESLRNTYKELIDAMPDWIARVAKFGNGTPGRGIPHSEKMAASIGRRSRG